MARVGVANYAHSTDHPVKQATYWRELLDREQRDHRFSSLNEPFPVMSYANLNTTSSDFLGRTWHMLNHTHSVAAGKTSFHHNVAKPMGRMKQTTSSGSIERLPDSMRNPALTATATRVLNPSASAGMLDQLRLTTPSPSMRSQRSEGRLATPAYSGRAG
eukprot:gnl/TRDRNA2_/TRDRNA2_181572_c0_seq1.p1 gnl/TRDRNA2_/TRDRNA2_181572_c0~~gnl/TRDRNA2_/TRDRNA2_181572_c0_seq1.p1  ORF type:complete len:160 (-),score=19.35 gnl/TRDRNA2_/TRDRNA2_181572_c0_seq1:82-561(-)